MCTKLKNYNIKPLIKSDTGENLFEYWKNVYSNNNNEYTSNDNSEYITFSFNRNINDLKHCLQILNNPILLRKFIYDIFMEKAEIYITHCLVLEKISTDENLKNTFKELKSKLLNNKNTKAIIDKINKNKNTKAIIDKINK